MDDFEENEFVNYLLSSSQSSVKRFLVLYFILNNKLLDAIGIVKQFGHELDLELEENKRIVDLIDAYSSKIPDCLSTLDEEITNILVQNRNGNPTLVVRTDDESTIKVNPKQRNVKNISSSHSIEKVLEMKESDLKRHPKSVQSALNDSNRSLYLSPIKSRQSKVIKTKNQNATKDLFLILKTPEVKRIIDSGSQMDSFSDSPRKPSILKHHYLDDSASDMTDRTTESHKLKVSFSLSKASKTNPRGRPKSSRPVITLAAGEADSPAFLHSSSQVAQFGTADRDETSTYSDTSELDKLQADEHDHLTLGRSRQKNPETPTHRMKLRSKRP